MIFTISPPKIYHLAVYGTPTAHRGRQNVVRTIEVHSSPVARSVTDVLNTF